MGLFTSKSTSKSELEMPEWMQGQPQEIANVFRNIINRDTIAPEDRIAGFSPNQQAAIDALAGYGSGAGADILQQIMDIGGGGIESGQAMIQDAIAGGPSVNEGLDMDRVAQYADNPYVEGQIQAALRDPRRQLEEQAMPQSRMAQALSGNTGSTRGAIGEAVLERGFQDRAADVAADFRGRNYRTGLGIESNRASQNAALAQQFMGTAVGAGSAMAGTGAMGADILRLANSIGLGNIDALMTAGGLETNREQMLRDWAFQNYNQPYTDAQWAASVINPMAEQYGTRKTTTKSSPSLGAVALGVGSAMMGMPGFGGGGQGFDPSGLNSATNFINPASLDVGIPRY